MPEKTSWDSETLYLDGDEFYRALLCEIDRAKVSVDMEVYIFEAGVLAERICDSFERATNRGVRVRLICDHWGGPLVDDSLLRRLEACGAQVHVYRGMPWHVPSSKGSRRTGGLLSILSQFWRRIRTLNRGFHRKVTLIDSRAAWVGSLNVSDVHLREVAGEAAWRDIGVRLTGKDVLSFRLAFERIFFRRRKGLSKILEKHWLVSFNDSFWARWKMNFQIKQRIKNFRQRVWIQNPYVLPPRSLLRALCRRARKGDVTIILPEKNDLVLMRYINHAILKKLLRRGVRVFERGGPFAHKKVLIVDSTYTIGSVNLNHRSFLHDLEVEVVLTREPTKRALEASFLADLAESRQITLQQLKGRPLWFRAASRVLFFFRYWC